MAEPSVVSNSKTEVALSIPHSELFNPTRLTNLVFKKNKSKNLFILKGFIHLYLPYGILNNYLV